ncbi:ROK family transcriptional regulator [Kitasatospora sp. MMS16-BH015]|uniref:ROK family transcriptional regulator n=1 Tax=Kitasatospora sp. MMS16-BH015 TaxID=2018025 RepID=UPI000CA1E929|nr:ROK family transcriptional regulator [Kitasatospora sp. MMS16-BH015]AUG75007.1 ROK family transcriptional regulator [Kitasatospora sp. MMS16-BH015]
MNVKPSDRASIRRTNLALVLRLLRDGGPRSRAKIADETGLPRPTITSLVAELIELGLIREGDSERDGSVGRPGLPVELDGTTVYGLGIEINVDYLAAVILDLRGSVTFERRIALDVRAAGVRLVLDQTAQLIREAAESVRERGHLVGAVLAAPGNVDTATGVVGYAPNIGWTRVRAIDELRHRLGPQAPALLLENDAKLGALAEYLVAAASDIHDLIYVTGETGVGGGIIIGGQLHRGAGGFAGEIGHMPLSPGGLPCACGRRGCWETMVGLGALLSLAADPEDPVHDPSLDVESRLVDLRRRADAGDPRTVSALARIADDLALGVALLADVLNPRAVVLGGWFAAFADHLLTPVREGVARRVMAPDAGGCEVLPSTLGFTAPARGGACLALDAVYRDPGDLR